MPQFDIDEIKAAQKETREALRIVVDDDGFDDWFEASEELIADTDSALRQQGELRSSTIVARKAVADLVFGFDDDGDNERATNPRQDLEQRSSPVQNVPNSDRNEKPHQATSHRRNSNRRNSNKKKLNKNSHSFPSYPLSTEEELPSVPGRRRANSLHPTGAFRVESQDAIAQRKGALTVLEENTRPMSYSELCGTVFAESRLKSSQEFVLSKQTPDKEEVLSRRRERGLWIWFAVTSVLIIVILITIVIVSVVFGLQNRAETTTPEDTNSKDESFITTCVEYGKEMYPNGQPDVHCQCELQGAITDILDSTKELYRDVKITVSGGLSVSNTSDFLSVSSSDELLSEFVLLNQSDCNDPRNVALLDLASRNSTDLARYGLMVLYLSMGVRFPEWNVISKPTCEWPGIFCDRDGMEKFDIELIETNLNGTIPTEIGLLSNMGGFNVGRYSGLMGTIPTEFGLLDQLKYMKLRDCNLEGTVPTEIGFMNSLDKLIVGGNALTGTLPSEIGKAQQLMHLVTGANELEGTIPTELMRLSSLETLDLSQNPIIGTIPQQVGTLTRLRKLNLRGLRLEGSIPWNEIVGMTDLEYFNLELNSLTGTLSSIIGKLTELEEFDVANNYIEGTIPSEIGLSTRLQILNIHSNELSGSIPSELASLTNLVTLFLRGNLDLFGNLEAFCEVVGSLQPEGNFRADPHILCTCCCQIDGEC